MNKEQRVKTLQEKADNLLGELQNLKAEADALLDEATSGLEANESILAGALAIRAELGISETDLEKYKPLSRSSNPIVEECHWCTGTGGV